MPSVDNFKVAAIQMTSTKNKKINLEKARNFIQKAAEENAKVTVLPEMFNFTGGIQEKKENAEKIPGPTIDFLREIARNKGIYILCGSILEVAEEKEEKLYNTSVFLDEKGDIIAIYRKIHLFNVSLPDGSKFEEGKLTAPGREIVLADTSICRFGLSICYDLRFPELYRRLAKKGARVIFAPSAFTLQTGKDHWETLVRARAIENQVYLIAANQIGDDTFSKRSWGKSMIVDPWGTVLSKAPDRETVIFANIDLSYQEKIRKDFPSLSHMREDIFTF